MKIIDTHCHIYLEEFDADRDAVLSRAEMAGVGHILCPAIDSRTHQRMHEVCRSSGGKLVAMMGLHPTSVKENFQEELKIVEEYLSKHQYIAIGEVGIDLYWDTTHIQEQEEAFLIQARWAASMGIPVVIHSRNSMKHLLDLLETNRIEYLTGVFHCFSGTVEEALRVVELGFYLGIGGPLTYKKSTLPDVIKQIPQQRIVLETDAPYLPPVPHRGKRNEPSYLSYIVQHLAQHWETSEEEARHITTSNAHQLFQLS